LAKSIKPADLEDAIKEELTLYHREVLEKVNEAGEKAVKELVKQTKKTAPKRLGDFRKAITYKEETNSATGDKEYTWGAKSPKHRLTHLLVKGHAKKNGGRVPGDPFLENALDQVLPVYENEVKEALENVK
jgi:hypothetical protein